MTDVERRLYRLLLFADAAAIVISAGIISLCLVVYGLYFWPWKR